MSRQFIAVRFDRGSRPYTYHNDGAPVEVGARVKIAGRRADEGWQGATVVEIVGPPAFETKAILGVVNLKLEVRPGELPLDEPAQPDELPLKHPAP